MGRTGSGGSGGRERSVRRTPEQPCRRETRARFLGTSEKKEVSLDTGPLAGAFEALSLEEMKHYLEGHTVNPKVSSRKAQRTGGLESGPGPPRDEAVALPLL